MNKYITTFERDYLRELLINRMGQLFSQDMHGPRITYKDALEIVQIIEKLKVLDSMK